MPREVTTGRPARRAPTPFGGSRARAPDQRRRAGVAARRSEVGAAQPLVELDRCSERGTSERKRSKRRQARAAARPSPVAHAAGAEPRSAIFAMVSAELCMFGASFPKRSSRVDGSHDDRPETTRQTSFGVSGSVAVDSAG